MSSTTKQYRSLKLQEKSPFYVFNDEEITLLGEFEWRQNTITAIKFTLKNLLPADLSRYRYKICCIQRCKGTYGPNYDALTIQLSSYKPSTINEISIKTVDLTSTNDEIDFNIDSEQLIVFNASDKECKTNEQNKCNNLYDCELDGNTPKTKNGAIIVGT